MNSRFYSDSTNFSTTCSAVEMFSTCSRIPPRTSACIRSASLLSLLWSVTVPQSFCILHDLERFEENRSGVS